MLCHIQVTVQRHTGKLGFAVLFVTRFLKRKNWCADMCHPFMFPTVFVRHLDTRAIPSSITVRTVQSCLSRVDVHTGLWSRNACCPSAPEPDSMRPLRLLPLILSPWQLLCQPLTVAFSGSVLLHALHVTFPGPPLFSRVLTGVFMSVTDL